MENLIVEYEGVKGKGLKTLGIKGRVVMTMGDNTITVDNFQGCANPFGYGSTYQQRETPCIKFEKNGEVIEFTSFNELWEKINK